MSSRPQLGGPNNPANKRKLIQSQVDQKELIVIDNGNQCIKIGRSGVDYPSIIIPTVAGFPHVISQNDVATPKRVYFGKDLRNVIDSKKYNVQFVYPINDSQIMEKHIDQMIDLWEYALVDLMGIDPTSADLLIIDSPNNSKQYKAKIIQILFEKLKVASVLFMNSSVLSLFSVGATIGLVAEIGHGTTTVVPVYEGFVLNHALQTSNIAGKKITNILQEQLKKNSISFQSRDQLQYMSIIKTIKQDNIKIAYDYQNQLLSDERTEEQMSYELPDGAIVQFSKETVYRPAQILFKQIDNMKPLPEMIQTSLDRCNEDLKSLLVKNIIFCGGSSMIQGIQDRIHRQLSNFGEELKIQFDWQRKYSAWIGGSMIGSLSNFQQLAITNNNEQTTNELIKKIL